MRTLTGVLVVALFTTLSTAGVDPKIVTPVPKAPELPQPDPLLYRDNLIRYQIYLTGYIQEYTAHYKLPPSGLHTPCKANLQNLPKPPDIKGLSDEEALLAVTKYAASLRQLLIQTNAAAK